MRVRYRSGPVVPSRVSRRPRRKRLPQADESRPQRIARLAHSTRVSWIPERSRVLDIGCFDAQLLETLGSRLDQGVGMDPAIERPAELGRYRLLPGEFPRVQPDDGPFDAVTLLAVLEHVPSDQIEQWARTCWDLRPRRARCRHSAVPEGRHHPRCCDPAAPHGRDGSGAAPWLCAQGDSLGVPRCRLRRHGRKAVPTGTEQPLRAPQARVRHAEDSNEPGDVA